MFQKFLILLVALVTLSLSPGQAQAHKPLLSVSDNNDGMMSIEAGFSDGGSAAGHKIILKNQDTGEVLLETRVGEDGSLELKKPSVNFTVTLDAGEGHVVTKVGPSPATAQETAAASLAPATQTAEPETRTKSPELTRADPPTQSSVPASPGNNQLNTLAYQQNVSGLVSGPGMAFEMMLITMIVTATASVLLLAIAVYFIGYRTGSRSTGNNTYGKEARGCSWCQDS